MCLNKTSSNWPGKLSSGRTGSRIASGQCPAYSLVRSHQTSKEVLKIHFRSDGVKNKNLNQSINHSWAQSSSVSGNRRVQLRPKKAHVWAKMAEMSPFRQTRSHLATKNRQKPAANVNRALVRVSRTQPLSFRERKTPKICQKVPGGRGVHLWSHECNYTAEENQCNLEVCECQKGLVSVWKLRRSIEIITGSQHWLSPLS